MKGKQKILIFIVVRNAAMTLEDMLERTTAAISECRHEILVMDDNSTDGTFERAARYRSLHPQTKLSLFCNPGGLGHGGIQKLGLHYALKSSFAAVAIMSGGCLQPQGFLDEFVHPVLAEEVDAVFETRKAGAARPAAAGSMACAVGTLKRIPIDLNADGLQFNVEMATQLKLNGSRLRWVPVATGAARLGFRAGAIANAWYALNVSFKAMLHRLNFRYDPQFEIVGPGQGYPAKFNFISSHTMAIDAVRPGTRVLDVGCGPGHVARELEKKNCRVTGIDIADGAEERSLQRFSKIDLNGDSLPFPPDSFDCILILDVLEHLDPAAQRRLLGYIRTGAKTIKPAVIITVPNVAFFFIRLQLLAGKFNYGQRGILDLTHRHLFTFGSIRRLLRQAGYKIEKVRGIPPPYPQVIGSNLASRLLLNLNVFLIWLAPGLFSYQIFIKTTPMPTTDQLLELAQARSSNREAAVKK